MGKLTVDRAEFPYLLISELDCEKLISSSNKSTRKKAFGYLNKAQYFTLVSIMYN